MKKWYWAVLFILTYLFFLVAYTPASFVTNYLSEQSQKGAQKALVFTDVTGTLFEGTASSVSSQGIRINNVKWELSPWSLLLLQANLDLTGGNIRHTDQIFVKGNIAASILSPNKFSLHNTQVFLPTRTLLSQLKLPVFVTALGRFRVDVDRFSFDQSCQVLQGKGNWLKAAVNVNQKQIDFGSFSASLACEDGAFAMQIEPSNKLSLDAKVVLDMTGKYNINGNFTMPSDMPNEIKQAAPYFGREVTPGNFVINL